MITIDEIKTDLAEISVQVTDGSMGSATAIYLTKNEAFRVDIHDLAAGVDRNDSGWYIVQWDGATLKRRVVPMLHAARGIRLRFKLWLYRHRVKAEKRERKRIADAIQREQRRAEDQQKYRSAWRPALPEARAVSK